jgi:hypothetical protein
MRTRLVTGGVLLLLVAGRSDSAEAPTVEFRSEAGKVNISVGGKPFATYVYQDKTISRPFFAHVHAPGGAPVTRNHPPVAGKDPTDHATFHPGLWLAFGDLSGADSWRNKAKVRHEKFVAKPKGGPGSGSFTVLNIYLAADGRKALCRETCTFTVHARPGAVLLVWDSEFRSDEGAFTFGDQEEMGLGVRVATSLTVKNGGKITTSAGDVNEKRVRGKTADWCDFSGTAAGRRVGVTLMPDPKNFRPSWYHARDYGLLVANPFGRKALTKGKVSQVVVKKGEAFRLRFGVLVHAAPAERPVDLKGAYKAFLARLAEGKK